MLAEAFGRGKEMKVEGNEEEYLNDCLFIHLAGEETLKLSSVMGSLYGKWSD